MNKGKNIRLEHRQMTNWGQRRHLKINNATHISGQDSHSQPASRNDDAPQSC